MQHPPAPHQDTMRRAARTDRNQQEVVDALRKLGATVQSLAPVGAGCPDLLVGYRGWNVLLEIKDGRKPPSARSLTPDQVQWHNDWRGRVEVVDSAAAACRLVIDLASRPPNTGWSGAPPGGGV